MQGVRRRGEGDGEEGGEGEGVGRRNIHSLRSKQNLDLIGSIQVSSLLSMM